MGMSGESFCPAVELDLADWVKRSVPISAEGDFAIAAVVRGEMVTFANGSLAPDRPYRLRCVQDALLGALFAQFHIEGLASLHQPVASLLPEIFLPEGFAGDIKVRHLLSRASGVWETSPNASYGELVSWADLVRECGPLTPKLRPGSLVGNSLIERILLIKIVENLTGQKYHESIADRLLGSDHGVSVEHPSGVLSDCYKELSGRLIDFTGLLSMPMIAQWASCYDDSTASKIATHPAAKPWAPVSRAVGLYRYGNGILGEDGDDPETGHIGLRIMPNQQAAIIGIFPNHFLRDIILSSLCADIIGASAPDARNSRIGNILDFNPQDLVGEYMSLSGELLFIFLNGDEIRIKPSAKHNYVMQIEVAANGDLFTKYAGNAIWIEPFKLSTGEMGIKMGRHPHLKM